MPKDLSPACEVRPADQSLKESPSHAEPARKVFGNRQMKSLRTNALPEHGVAKGVVDAQIRKIERREWWLWTSAILVTLLLTLGIVSFLVPITNAIRGLVGMVLLFDIYTVYQQLQICRIRR